jgi:hypothetical protein
VEKADGSSTTFTADGFKTVLRALGVIPKLTVLDMQLSHVKELYINCMGIYLLLSLGVHDGGVQFVAQNIKYLTILKISM